MAGLSLGERAVAQAMALSKNAVAKDEAGSKADAIRLYSSAVDHITCGLAAGMPRHLEGVRTQYIGRIKALGGKPPSLSHQSIAVRKLKRELEAAAVAAVANRGCGTTEVAARAQSQGQDS